MNFASSQDSSGYLVPTGRAADSTPDQVAGVVLNGASEHAHFTGASTPLTVLAPNPVVLVIIETAPVTNAFPPFAACCMKLDCSSAPPYLSLTWTHHSRAATMAGSFTDIFVKSSL